MKQYKPYAGTGKLEDSLQLFFARKASHQFSKENIVVKSWRISGFVTVADLRSAPMPVVVHVDLA